MNHSSRRLMERENKVVRSKNGNYIGFKYEINTMTGRTRSVIIITHYSKVYIRQPFNRKEVLENLKQDRNVKDIVVYRKYNKNQNVVKRLKTSNYGTKQNSR